MLAVEFFSLIKVSSFVFMHFACHIEKIIAVCKMDIKQKFPI